MISRIKSILHKVNLLRRGQNLSWPKTIIYFLNSRFKEKLILDESLASGAYVLKNPDKPKQRTYPRLVMEPFLRDQNRNDSELISDKAVFSQFVKGTDIPVPKTYAIFNPGEGAGEEFGLTDSMNYIRDRKDWLRLISKDLPENFIVKPATGQGGSTIDIYRRQRDDRLACKGKIFTFEQVYDRITREQMYGKCVIQEVARNHPEIDAFTGATALQCLRILTVRSKTSGIKVFSCEFKIAGSADQDTDNFKGGTTGNILCKVDVKTGAIYDAMSLDMDKLEYYHLTKLPLTQRDIIGFKIPLFQEALEVTCLAHRAVSGQKYVGWDVAISDRGPLVIEGNWLWGGSSLTTPWFNYDDYEIMTQMAS